MRKIKYISAIALSLLMLAGCDKAIPSFETVGSNEATTATEATTEAAATTIAPTTEEPTTVAMTTAMSIEITTVAPETTTSSSGHMEANNLTYKKNNVLINYPEILGMTDTEVQDWVNTELKNDVMSLLKFYKVDEEKDTFKLDYEVSTIYRGEFSLVYTGEFTKAGGNTVMITAAEDFDLTEKKHIRLSDRLAVAKVIKCILGDDSTAPEYEIIKANISDETLKNYLSQQKDEYFENLVYNADFGGSKTMLGAYSYNYMNNVAIILPLPHVMGDYAIISIKQNTK